MNRKRFFITLYVFVILIIVFPGSESSNAYNSEIKISHDYLVSSNLYNIIDLGKKDFFSPLYTGREENIVYDAEENYIIFYGPFYFGYIEEKEERIFLNQGIVSLLAEYAKASELQDSKYHIKLESFYQAVEGLIIGGKLWDNKILGLEVEANLKLLQGRKLLTRDYQGEVKIDQETIDVKGEKIAVHSDVGEEMSVANNNFYGAGLSGGYKIDWQIDSNRSLSFNVDNALSLLYWHDVYTEGGEYNSNNLVIGDDGYLEYDSIYKGVFDFKDYYTTLTPEYKLVYQDKVYSTGLLYYHQFYPFFSFLLLDDTVKGIPLKIKGGFFKDYISLSCKLGSIDINLKTKSLDLSRTTGLSATVKFGIPY